ncbi:formate--tetrahydrofolate ligase [Aquisalimonas asiatica]|uniref:Formate--tetrahydrofolate ligase n=1 Tax=Aquisalimonas asiatica TaxID=406100 RepID=A0A1H8UVM6_9GAMM|nr:formate--tetrahydrofolate ligase [Aquisalimonas asiatica]SEP06994.1 Formate-tetrahydrofolate ligase [Aquisalimonas asiatica]
MATSVKEVEAAVADVLPSNLEIARHTPRRPIGEIAAAMGLDQDYVEPYGHDVAKIDLTAMHALADRPRGKYVVVSAITPTPLGEGKTTTSIGLAQGFHHIARSAAVALRQPSMGPTLGIKGGAAGGGYSQVIPMERINLHLTGDIHAVSSAHNLLSAMIDNHLHHRRGVDLDPQQISWKRTMDINDRALRNIVTGLGSSADGFTRQSSFEITAASEVMAILALAHSLSDLRARLGRIVVGYTRSHQPVTAEDIGAAGAMTALLKDALKPNLLQTLEHTPALMHAGPFGNIAHGNSSIVADRIALRTSDYLITEAGFGADMGAERFFNIKCRASGMVPDAAVLVATVRGLKFHSGRFRVVPGRPLPEEMTAENPDDVYAGADNLRKQIDNIRAHGIAPVVAINVFPTDYASEHEAIRDVAEQAGARVALCTHVRDGGAGAAELAEAVAAAAEEPNRFEYLYPDDMHLDDKIKRIATRIYGAGGVEFSAEARRQIDSYQYQGYGDLPVCIAKTHLSLSADAGKQGAPTGWVLPVREVRLSAGAGFVYALCGEMRTMPGLGTDPAAAHIDIDENEQIVGLF